MSGETNQRMREPMVRWSMGEDEALAEVLEIAYASLCRKARSLLHNQPHKEPEALVHKAFMALGEVPRKSDPEYFLALMAQKMRWMMIDEKRAAKRLKRGGSEDTLSLSELDATAYEVH
jgi:DNA-directed RNA polymerase specialized sigma24 family protein